MRPGSRNRAASRAISACITAPFTPGPLGDVRLMGVPSGATDLSAGESDGYDGYFSPYFGERVETLCARVMVRHPGRSVWGHVQIRYLLAVGLGVGDLAVRRF